MQRSSVACVAFQLDGAAADRTEETSQKSTKEGQGSDKREGPDLSPSRPQAVTFPKQWPSNASRSCS